MILETLSGPNGSLVSETDMLVHLGLPNSDGPAIRSYLATATELIDGNPTKSITGASIRDRTLRLTVDLEYWEPIINLPGPPVTRVTTIEYDNSGTWTGLPPTWRLRQKGLGAQVVMGLPFEWPEGGTRIRVTYEAGSQLAIPVVIQEAAKHLAGTLFAVRNSHLTEEDGVTGAARNNPITMRLLKPYIVKNLFTQETSTPV